MTAPKLYQGEGRDEEQLRKRGLYSIRSVFPTLSTVRLCHGGPLCGQYVNCGGNWFVLEVVNYLGARPFFLEPGEELPKYDAVQLRYERYELLAYDVLPPGHIPGDDSTPARERLEFWEWIASPDDELRAARREILRLRAWIRRECGTDDIATASRFLRELRNRSGYFAGMAGP